MYVRRTCISVNTELCLVCLKGRPKGVREEDVYICEYGVVFDVSEGTS